MNVEQFWTAAFLAALHRLPAPDASDEADLATKLCIEKWQPDTTQWRSKFVTRWRKVNIFNVPPTHNGTVREGRASNVPLAREKLFKFFSRQVKS